VLPGRSHPMRRIHIALLLPLLLALSQQGAMLHELGHLHRLSGVPTWTEMDLAADRICQLCIAFSQVANPASASVPISPSPSAAVQPGSQPDYSIVAADIPTPRSRGPPTHL